MGTFSASLRVQGDTSALPATLLVEDGRIKINSGDQPIGDWSLSEVDLNRTEAGYQMHAEGESLFLSVTDIAAFDEALSTKKDRKRRAKKKKEPKSTAARQDHASAPAEPKPEKEPKPKKDDTQNKVMSLVDGLVERAERRFGPLLPSWVFSRFTVFALFAALVGAIIFPGIASGFALLVGLGIVVFGAVLYTDDRMATKLLPGRSTPTHVLITGVGILLVGVLIGTLGT